LDFKFLSHLKVEEENISINTENPLEIAEIAKDIRFHQEMVQSNRIFSIPFESVVDYLEVLEYISKQVNALGERVMFYLAAAVSDFYIPMAKMVEHKIQSSSGNLLLDLDPVPKMLSVLRKDWAPKSFIVSFKLETDEELVIHKAKRAIINYNVDVVIANQLHTRRDVVHLVSSADRSLSFTVVDIRRPAEVESIDSIVTKEISDLHCNFINSTDCHFDGQDDNDQGPSALAAVALSSNDDA
jgi:phosphopantothenate-cysteine ligase